jgi:hypothetical protein
MEGEQKIKNLCQAEKKEKRAKWLPTSARSV